MHFDFLQELIAVFMISIVVILICAKFKIPSIVALLVAGIICGPSALKLVSEIEAVDIMAEVGVALLLFTIGMELSLRFETDKTPPFNWRIRTDKFHYLTDYSNIFRRIAMAKRCRLRLFGHPFFHRHCFEPFPAKSPV